MIYFIQIKGGGPVISVAHNCFSGEGGDGHGLAAAECREEEGMRSPAMGSGSSDAAVPEGQGRTAASSTSRNIEPRLSGGMTGQREEPGERAIAPGPHDQSHDGDPIFSENNIGQRVAHGAADHMVDFVGMEGARARH
jgi:hypothetical protein